MALVVDSRRRWGEGLVAWPPFAGSTRTLPSFSRIMCQKARRCQGTNRDVKIFTLSMFWCVFQPHFDECVILCLKAFKGIYLLFFVLSVCGSFSWITDWHWNAFNMYLYVCVGVLVISSCFAWPCKHVSTYVAFDVSIYRYGTLNT